MGKRTAAVVAILGILVSLVPSKALASTGPYTFPFFDHQNFVTGPWAPTANPPHLGIDYSLGYELVASANAGVVEDVVESHNDHPNDGVCRNPGYSGNFVLIRHANDSNRRTLYLHVQKDSVTVTIGQSVVAGQKIATSGNSGKTCGAHLHYGLFTNASWTVGANALNPNGRWTTDPGRVPWRGVYHSESNSGTEYIQRYTTRNHWVKFTNIGGRPWKSDGSIGSVYLSATTDNGQNTRSSAFEAADWTSPWNATNADQATVGVGSVGTFTFGLYAAPAPGYYTSETFNLRANATWWFDITTSPTNRYWTPIQVTAPPPGCPPVCPE